MVLFSVIKTPPPPPSFTNVKYTIKKQTSNNTADTISKYNVNKKKKN